LLEFLPELRRNGEETCWKLYPELKGDKLHGGRTHAKREETAGKDLLELYPDLMVGRLRKKCPHFLSLLSAAIHLSSSSSASFLHS